MRTKIINLGNERRHAGARAQAQALRRRGLEHIPAVARDGRRAREWARARVHVCGGVRARGRGRVPDNPRRLGARAGSARRRLPGDAGPVRMCAPPHLPSPHVAPDSPRTRGAARGTFVDLELSVTRSRGTLRPLPTPQAPQDCTHRARELVGGTPEPCHPLPSPGFKEPLAAGRPGGRAKG